MTVNERAARALKEILQKPGNDACADCGAAVPTDFESCRFSEEKNKEVVVLHANPEWASCSLGVFICLGCSGIHRNLPEIGKVKSVTLSRWEDSEIQFMAERGNKAMKAEYEAVVPVYYYKPTHKDCQALREQWIRAKYERKEFSTAGRKLPYEEGMREGMLMKRGRDNGQFFSRRFVLLEREGTLKYYAKQDAKMPKAVLKVDTINATFQPGKIGNPNGLQITYLKENITRNIFLYHESSKEIVDWFNSIRYVQFHYLKVAFPGSSDAELKPKLTRNFLKEGYMEKTGPRQTEGFKRRWFTLDHRRLMYFKDPLDAFAKGEVYLAHRDLGYSVCAGLPAGTHCNSAWQHGITIVTPVRSFLFTCESESEQQDWISHFSSVIGTSMSPQEYSMEALFKHKY